MLEAVCTVSSNYKEVPFLQVAFLEIILFKVFLLTFN